MEQKDLEKLVELSRQGFKCPNKECCEYEKYNQCYNHSHVLCQNFEEYYQRRQNNPNRKV
jgi:hypothetical protein